MGDYSVSNVDGEAIARIARASLRDEIEVPRSVIGRLGLRDRSRGNKGARDHRGKQKPLHHDFFSGALSALPRIYGDEPRRRCSNLLQSLAIIAQRGVPLV